MVTLSKKQMRSLPTLTEVVPPTSAVQAEGQPPTIELDIDQITEKVMERLDLNLHGYIHEVVESLIQAHIEEVEPRLKQKVSMAVRQVVAKTVASVIKEESQPAPKA